MQPYQEADQEMKRRGELPYKAVKTAASIAGTVGTTYAGGLALNKVIPFLSKYIPETIATAALNKIDPRFGKFFKKALQHGSTFDDAREFIKEKIMPKEESQKPEVPKYNEQQAPIPESNQAITTPITKQQEKYAKNPDILNKIKQFKEPKQLQIGYDEPPQQKALKKFTDRAKKKSMMQEEEERFLKTYGKQPQSPQTQQPQATPQVQSQGSNSDAMIIAALQKVLSM